MKKTILILATAGIVFTGCKKDKDEEDTVNPNFVSVRINGSEMMSEDFNEVHNGEKLVFEISTADDVELSQLSVSIHEGEGHEHEGHDHRMHKGEEHEPLTFSATAYDLSGETNAITTVTVSDKLENEEAEYHLELQLLDKAGNSTTAIQEFFIEEEGHEGH